MELLTDLTCPKREKKWQHATAGTDLNRMEPDVCYDIRFTKQVKFLLVSKWNKTNVTNVSYLKTYHALSNGFGFR